MKTKMREAGIGIKQFVTCTAIIGLLGLATPATAAIISNPASLVDHGTYITDTATNLDWLKFAPTLGLSFDAAVAANAADGWQGATLGQIHGLWFEFGYVGDTPSPAGGLNANAGLTDALALAVHLGYTFPGNPPPAGCCGDRLIVAFRAEFESPGVHWMTFMGIDVITNTLNDQVDSFLPASSGYGDNGNGSAQVGTWLVRESVVPEPATYALMLAGLGLLGIAARLRKQKEAF